jgi:hypothetical protein
MFKMTVGSDAKTRVIVDITGYKPETALRINAIKAVHDFAQSSAYDCYPANPAINSLRPLKSAKDFVEELEKSIVDARDKYQPLTVEVEGATQTQLDMILAICFFYLGVSHANLKRG